MVQPLIPIHSEVKNRIAHTPQTVQSSSMQAVESTVHVMSGVFIVCHTNKYCSTTKQSRGAVEPYSHVYQYNKKIQAYIFIPRISLKRLFKIIQAHAAQIIQRFQAPWFYLPEHDGSFCNPFIVRFITKWPPVPLRIYAVKYKGGLHCFI